jgi:SprT protein
MSLELPPAIPAADEIITASAASPLHAAVEACYRRAEKFYRCRFERPRLTFDLRGMAAAVALTAANTIRINRALLAHNLQDFLDETVPHEVSHLLAHCLHGPHIAPHGAEWAAIMRTVFGREPRRCHDYDVRPGLVRAYRYRCGCPEGHTLGTRRHRSAQRGRRYHCRRCHQPLEFSHTEDGAIETRSHRRRAR